MTLCVCVGMCARVCVYVHVYVCVCWGVRVRGGTTCTEIGSSNIFPREVFTFTVVYLFCLLTGPSSVCV